MIQYAWLIPALPAFTYVFITLFTRNHKALSAVLSILTMGVCLVLSVGILLQLLGLDPSSRISAFLHLAGNLPLVGPGRGPDRSLERQHAGGGDPRFAVGSNLFPGDTCMRTRASHPIISYLSLFTASMLVLVLSTSFLQIVRGLGTGGALFLSSDRVLVPQARGGGRLQKGFHRQPGRGHGLPHGGHHHRHGFPDLRFRPGPTLVISEGLAHHTLPSLYVAGIALLLFGGAVGKSAQFPLHVWLPDAMEGPTPVSALIHAATMVAAGVFMVARTYLLFSADPTAMTAVAWTGGFTAIFAATIALAQDDIKRILAYSTLSQLGYMILALGAGGYTQGMFHLTTHACFKALLFLGAGSVIHGLHNQDIWKMGGLAKKMKITAFTFAVATLAIAGIFPLAGFFSKDAILDVVRESTVPGHEILYAAAVFTAFLTAFYMFRLFFVVFTGEPRDPHAHEHAHESPLSMTGPLMVLALLSICVGWLNYPGFDGYSKFLHYGNSAPAVFDWTMGWVSVGIAFLGIGLAACFYYFKIFSAEKMAQTFRPIYLLLKNKYYVDEFYGWLVKKVVFGLATLFTWFDDNVVDDGMVDGLGWTAAKMGGFFRLTQTGYVQNYALVIFGAVSLIFLFVSF